MVVSNRVDSAVREVLNISWPALLKLCTSQKYHYEVVKLKSYFMAEPSRTGSVETLLAQSSSNYISHASYVTQD